MNNDSLIFNSDNSIFSHSYSELSLCKCVMSRETNFINGVEICTICNKPTGFVKNDNKFSFINNEKTSNDYNIDAFKEELTILLNKYSMENGSNTPDYILANYLVDCLKNFNNIVNDRSDWYK